MKLDDLTGKKFGKITVICRDKIKEEDVKSKRPYWKCICDCGKEIVVNSTSLISGRVTDCKNVRLEKGESSFNMLFRNYRQGAISRNLSFELSKEDFRKLTKENCYYCGEAPSQIAKKADKGNEGNGYYIYNGVDRINNNEGYTLENSVPCCKNCNNAKKSMDVNDFLSWVSRVYKYSIEKEIK